MEKELARRKCYDEDMHRKVELMRQYLKSEIDREHSVRLDFNE